MGRIRFAVNLRPDTANDGFVAALDPWGWLSAPANGTVASRRYAASSGREFIADNGNFARIGRIAAPHRATGRTLRAEVGQLERTIGRSAHRRDLPADLAGRYDDLAAVLIADLARDAPDDDAMIDAQLAVTPSRLIGVEDLLMACLLSVHVEPQFLDWPRERWRRINRAVARRATRVRARRAAELGTGWYPVASALDHPAAIDAGREFAAAGLEQIAMGFGAFMADDYSEDRLRIGRRTVPLGEQLPQRYVRTAVVARGLIDGYREVAGRPPQAIHLLGLGAPIMMGIAALACREVEEVSFDAMSPIRDAVEGTLYMAAGAYLKVRTRAIARRICDGQTVWRCPCPFCAAFTVGRPFNESAAQAWGASHPHVAIPAAALRPRGDLYRHLPLLAEPAAGTAPRRAVNEARAGHNHWVLIQVCAQLEAAQAAGNLVERVETVVDSYENSTNSPRFARAVRLGLRIARDGDL